MSNMIAITALSSLGPERLRALIGRAIGLFPPHVERAATADWIAAVAARPALHDARWSALGVADASW